jgi:hypothetical protein
MHRHDAAAPLKLCEMLSNKLISNPIIIRGNGV